MSKKPMKTKKQIEEERKAKIPGIREMRLESRSLTDIAAYFEVSVNFVSDICKDIKVDIKRNQKNKKYYIRNPLPCKNYSINELNEADKQKYNSLQPPKKDQDKNTYISAKKGDYFKAAIFEDNRRGLSREFKAQ